MAAIQYLMILPQMAERVQGHIVHLLLLWLVQVTEMLQVQVQAVQVHRPHRAVTEESTAIPEVLTQAPGRAIILLRAAVVAELAELAETE